MEGLQENSGWRPESGPPSLPGRADTPGSARSGTVRTRERGGIPQDPAPLSGVRQLFWKPTIVQSTVSNWVAPQFTRPSLTAQTLGSGAIGMIGTDSHSTLSIS